ncbi:hypothetical protein SK128_012109 [Halocaridina rubra]|uniref:Uncharacterized protein n=1 Tax=Halocaridina rubra TaxID=373956 RepID=A0AAN9A497_HALRR
MEEDDSVSEDEWTSVKRRFAVEGLEWDTLESHNCTLHVWRMLVDAEANLKAARHVSDKLRRQHDEEKIELEEYTEHLRLKCEERVKELDDEVKVLKEDLEALLVGTQAVTAMLLKEGLHDVAQSSLGEQIAYLLVERSKLTEELNTARTKPSSDHEKELTSQLIKVSTDFELLKRTHQEAESQLTEMRDRVSLLEKASRQLEVDNETLAYKLSEALAEIEDNEGQLRRYNRNPSLKHCDSINFRSHDDYGPPSLRSLPLSEGSLTRGDSYRRSLRRRESPRNSGRKKKNEPLKAERGKSPRSSSRRRHSSRSGSLGKEIGENREDMIPLDVCDTSLPLSGRNHDKCETQSNSSHIYTSPSHQKLHSLLDGQILNSRNQLTKLDEVKQLQDEINNIKKDLVVAGDRYEFIVRKYELYKIRSKSKVTCLRSKHVSDVEAFKKKNDQLEAQLSLQEDKLRAEEALRKQVEESLSAVRTERQDMAVRVRNSVRQVQDHENEIKLLREKISLIQDANNQLNEKLQELSITAIVG